jgi:hypothetical protein
VSVTAFGGRNAISTNRKIKIICEPVIKAKSTLPFYNQHIKCSYDATQKKVSDSFTQNKKQSQFPPISSKSITL